MLIEVTSAGSAYNVGGLSSSSIIAPAATTDI